MNLSTIKAAYDVFRKGSALTKPEVLHDKAALVAAITALITALGNALPKLFGIDLGWLTPEVVNLLAGGIAAVFLIVLHYTTSPDRGLPGLPPKPEPAPEPEDTGRAGG